MTVVFIYFRSHYIASQLGARIMTKQDKGLIVNISSAGGGTFGFGPLYGIGKCAVRNKGSNVLALSIKCKIQP